MVWSSRGRGRPVDVIQVNASVPAPAIARPGPVKPVLPLHRLDQVRHDPRRDMLEHHGIGGLVGAELASHRHRLPVVDTGMVTASVCGSTLMNNVVQSPGKPTLRRDVERLLWRAMSKRLTSDGRTSAMATSLVSSSCATDERRAPRYVSGPLSPTSPLDDAGTESPGIIAACGPASARARWIRTTSDSTVAVLLVSRGNQGQEQLGEVERSAAIQLLDLQSARVAVGQDGIGTMAPKCGKQRILGAGD